MPYRTDNIEEKYRPVLLKFMRFRDGADYSRDHVFTTEELATVTPSDICRWMKFRAYGTPDPSRDANPTEARSGSLLTWKKAISFYMPNNGMQWNELSSPPTGNPTRSSEVNNLIAWIKKKETRKQGKVSKKRRPLQAEEFEYIMDTVEKHYEGHKAYFTLAYFRYQVAMIARLDDTAKLRLDSFATCSIAPAYAIMTKLVWSKNVMSEEDCPFQILLGAMDERYCSILGLGLWLESAMTYGDLTEYVFEYEGSCNPHNIKQRASKYLTDILRSTGFSDLLDNFLNLGLTGSHSVRKFATTLCRRLGVSKDYVDYRARWKGNRRQQDDYTDLELPLPDAKAAAALCKGGPIGYKIKEESGISDSWLLDYVVPNCGRKFPRNVALVLGRAILWKTFEDQVAFVNETIVNRIKGAYHDLGSRNKLGEGVNPVDKVPLIVYSGGTNDDQVIIEELIGFDGGNNDGAGNSGGTTSAAAQSSATGSDSTVVTNDGTNSGGSTVGNNMNQSFETSTSSLTSSSVSATLPQVNDRRNYFGNREELRYLNSQIMGLRRENVDLRQELQRRDDCMLQLLSTMNRNFKRYMNQPAHTIRRSRTSNNATSGDGAAGSATNSNVSSEENELNAIPIGNGCAQLSSRPRTLYTLWHEYEFGLGHNKAAKDFTSFERGKVKHVYCKRKIVWDVVATLVKGGWTSKRAIDKIYEVYGNEPVTKIIASMKADKERGGHPSLRVANI